MKTTNWKLISVQVVKILISVQVKISISVQVKRAVEPSTIYIAEWNLRTSEILKQYQKDRQTRNRTVMKRTKRMVIKRVRRRGIKRDLKTTATAFVIFLSN